MDTIDRDDPNETPNKTPEDRTVAAKQASTRAKTHEKARSNLLSGPALLLVGGATLLTLAGAALSAFAVNSEPTMRAEDSPYETTSKAVLVRRDLARMSTPRYAAGGRSRATSGATDSEVYVDERRDLANRL
ncbi:MAG: hypothetical protein JRG92_07570 [Deltaproteobacteria bacterium]|nr:hypothetical protein [Deltaproteobacteria bacterium]MBW2383477.1 hypothetical protein [Deltaproteobacteria bacterium]